MYTSDTSSVFSALKKRELGRCKVDSRPSARSMTADGACIGSGVLMVEPNGAPAPPLAISFGKTPQNSSLLAVADEEGFVSIFNTCLKLPSALKSPIMTRNARKDIWMAHSNAVFDISWVQDDRQMLTASGDQTVRLWDIEARAGLGVMKGHSGSVKTLCAHPYQPELFASGSRDGTVALWDVRSKFLRNGANERCFGPVSVIKDAHILRSMKKTRGSKGATMSVTAVLFLKDERILATAGAADGVVKFWDTRQLKSPVVQTPPHAQVSMDGKEKRVHGISGLSQHPSGTHLIASSTDSRVYVYDVQRLERGSLKSFQGHVLGSFYIKAAFSPDGTHVLSGSSDGNVFIWQMDSPESPPVILKGHGGEVTAVDWCSTDFCKIATCSDDFTVRIWKNVDPQFTSAHACPSALRRRVCADPTSDVAEAMLFDRLDSTTCSTSPCSQRTSKVACDHEPSASTVGNSDVQTCTTVENSTESCEVMAKKSSDRSLEASPTSRPTLACKLELTNLLLEKSPEARSPSSVLNPPSSSKRRKTIIDYYRA